MKRLGIMTLIACLILTGCVFLPVQDNPPAQAAPCSVEMLDVGQGLCILVQMDGEYLLYDGGGRESSSYVVRRLKDMGIRDIKYMIASHYDEDHISGLVGVLSAFEVGHVLAPDYEVDTKIFRSFHDKIRECGLEPDSPNPGVRYSLGSGEILVLGPEQYDDPVENNRSIAVMLSYGEFRCLITGDAEQQEEANLVVSRQDLSADLYVAGHHGSASSNTPAFIRSVSPRFVFFSCGEGNAYGHPSAKTLQIVQDAGAEIFRTDRQGSVGAFSDGTQVWFSSDSCQDWTPGNPNQTVSSSGGDVLNKRSMRFHRPDCDSVRQISPSNREDSEASREELIAQGYQPCGACNP
ncbi:MAG: MBL fold metallo-hydrolase [Oscillospiraceae bacterium]|nr:MBL fold metallo-hydrolase [Oscillospiraceae bacterium]